MNVNFGLFPPLNPSKAASKRGGGALARKQAVVLRALADLEGWLKPGASVAAE
jgi:hypothetical protein